MATSNLGRFFKERYTVAMAKYETNRHDDALTQFSELLMEESLSPVYRLKANVALADGVDDWFLAEQYRLVAEDTYHGISEVVADNRTDDEEGRELAADLAASHTAILHQKTASMLSNLSDEGITW